MITPNNNTLNDNYLITAVTGVPNASQGQIQARVFSFTTPPQSKTVGATGIMQKAGVKAIGKLTFYNGMTTDQTVPIGTPFYVHGVTVVNLVDAQIPAAVPPMMGQITVPAQAINVGSDGNVAALAINQPCCSSNNTIFVRNLSAFTGGQDDLDYTFVKQSDIEGAASSLDQSLTPSARSSLQTQVHSNEALIASPQCAKKVSSNHNVGDRVDKVDVTVVITCTGEVYDKQALEKMTTNLLKQEATQKLSANYVLVDNMVKTKVTRITVVDSVKGMISLQVKAEGLWVYQFDDIQKQALIKLVVGKKLQDAIKILKQQTGVLDVQIDEGVENLPTDPANIIIKIKPVQSR